MSCPGRCAAGRHRRSTTPRPRPRQCAAIRATPQRLHRGRPDGGSNGIETAHEPQGSDEDGARHHYDPPRHGQGRRHGQLCARSSPGVSHDTLYAHAYVSYCRQPCCSPSLITHVRAAVLSHLGVDPVDALAKGTLQQNSVELHVHHHHHVYVDQNPRMHDASRKEYEELANTTLLDMLWAKNKPCYGKVNITSPTLEQQTPAEGAQANNKGTATKQVRPHKLKRLFPGNKSSQGVDKANLCATTKSKVRCLEAAAQERIKKLSDLGTLIARGFQTDTKETFCQTQPNAPHTSQQHKKHTLNERFQAAEASFVAALNVLTN
ncbi:uncharacterized protein LOC112349188 [Selaginella moellendorffii]|uniref:uncharacterized protein LOC112349188 n=1 Tax=Selaginella moellendorffii TaxID=88036 RepID=UPI000D1C7171|nr:uncharacterized protein LOC112349188 [Selaginella moellendorffii]|eukprot:XP_024538893.1 uncharacterized protein LOC112349188 [Selaginella moellendorffii]